MQKEKTDYLKMLRGGEKLTVHQQLLMILTLSIPGMLAQLSTIAMEYIDASMVGQLGKADSAAIGLVSTTTWLVGGLCTSAGIGFTVQVAHRLGAEDGPAARNVMRIGLIFAAIFSLVLAAIGLAVSGALPGWLGGGEEIQTKASHYFAIFVAALPAMQLFYTTAGFLEASGNMKLPSIVSALECGLDIVFNYIFIYVCDMGVVGAALGTAVAEVIAAGILLFYVLRKSPELKIRAGEKIHHAGQVVEKAVKMSIPQAIESLIMGGAQIIITLIVAPLGNVAIAANSFAITAESLCYMPGYGIQSAAVTMIGQSVGAGRKDILRRLGWSVVIFGAAIMTASGILMYIFAPEMIGILSPDPAIRELGTRILRIEAFAEPMFGASIVAAGVFHGTGDTLHPTIFYIASMWLVRLPMAFILSKTIGLRGVWIAMAVELTVRGILFLIRLSGRKWHESLKNEKVSIE